MLNNDPLIGIWWDHGGRLAVFAETIDPGRAVCGICDSDFAHDACWHEAAKQLSLSSTREYFDVPRGRVMWHVKDSRSVILHGNGTSRDRLESIASKFQLSNWRAETDLHYMVGEDAETLWNFL
ncbi:hypothetical protein Poly24_16380 [Rosistilla carotiformis]|uniref:Uncharacterized protein n=2 Tax=Rosistilla carotiformis TaxID=2528017 RepID=A0A518JQW2_9BACT|nr:hypothetical protein Poly24_16380 [Rosistilla carotiformis]